MSKSPFSVLNACIWFSETCGSLTILQNDFESVFGFNPLFLTFVFKDFLKFLTRDLNLEKDLVLRERQTDRQRQRVKIETDSVIDREERVYKNMNEKL